MKTLFFVVCMFVSAMLFAQEATTSDKINTAIYLNLTSHINTSADFGVFKHFKPVDIFLVGGYKYMGFYDGDWGFRPSFVGKYGMEELKDLKTNGYNVGLQLRMPIFDKEYKKHINNILFNNYLGIVMKYKKETQSAIDMQLNTKIDLHHSSKSLGLIYGANTAITKRLLVDAYFGFGVQDASYESYYNRLIRGRESIEGTLYGAIQIGYKIN